MFKTVIFISIIAWDFLVYDNQTAEVFNFDITCTINVMDSVCTTYFQ